MRRIEEGRAAKMKTKGRFCYFPQMDFCNSIQDVACVLEDFSIYLDFSFLNLFNFPVYKINVISTTF